jgi:hypothetical protein
MSLRELAMPSMEDIEMQKSDLTLATTHYEVKPGIIKLVGTNPFRGLEDDNPYRHIKEFMMICNTVLSYGPLWAHYLGGYQDRLLGGPLGLPALCRTVPDGVRRKDYGGEVLG